MNREKRKTRQRKRRHRHVRHRLYGTAERPRLSVFRSQKHIYAQIINDEEGRTLASTSTLDKDVREEIKSGGNVHAGEVVGTKLAEVALAAGIKKVALDRGYCKFHGRIKALAEAARKGGLVF
ncbi:MAG: 50S ribosomal protein L18 [Planctomycetes bacterium DG_58]|nr:MAG: 50S ribosomal protein L18 [Planctomycetes bacterium DG_58]KPL02886.1 MAG: 50S ribosomal protein L18 [Planctomycetes bacterium SM23_65]